MKRFLVTGCYGYIGSHMVYELHKNYDCQIVGVDLQDRSDKVKGVDRFVQGNLCSEGVAEYALEQGPYDAIFHFAALASVPEGEKRPFDYYYSNVVSTANLLKACKDYGELNFIMSSTCAVYGDIIAPIHESMPLNPKSVYAKTKAICESLVENVPDMNTAILRYFNAAGRNNEDDLHEDHYPETHLIPLLTKLDKIQIYGKDYSTKDGTCIRDYIHVIDLCQAHIKAYEHIKDGKNIVCNLGTGKGYSVKEIVDLVNERLNRNIEIEYADRRQGDVPMLVSDVTRMKNVLQFLPHYDIVGIIDSMRPSSKQLSLF